MNVNVWDVNEQIQALIRAAARSTSRAWPIPASRSTRPSRRRELSAAMNRPRNELHDAGVSIWLDTLSRDLLESGGFAALIRDYGVTGATSNPTIFAKAITGSDRYDEQLRRAGAAGSATIGRSCSSRSRSTTSAQPPACCVRPMTAAAAGTASSRSSARPTSPTTPRRRSPRRPTSGSGSASPT